MSYLYVQTLDDVAEMMDWIEGANRIAFDTETYKTNNWTQRKILGASFTVEDFEAESYRSFYVPVGQPYLIDYLPKPVNRSKVFLQALPWQDKSKQWIAHNAKFDLQVLRNIGCADIAGPLFDTQIMAHLVDENHFAYGLDWLAKHYFGLEKIPTKELEKKFTWEGIPPYMMGQYACQDTELTFRLFTLLHGMMDAQRLYEKPVWSTSVKGVRTLDHLVDKGIRVDVERLAELSEKAAKRMQELENELGWRPSQIKETKERLFGPRGYKLPVLARQPKTNEPKIDRPTLQRLQARYTHRPEVVQVLDGIIEFRTLQKAKSTWYDGFISYADDDHRVHPGLKQHGTDTGRLSCAEPNTQQLPRDTTRTPVKECFLADRGYELWELDYSQIELRLGARYAKERRMLDAYRNGDDLHHLTAELIGSYDFFEQRSEGRQIGKTGNFLWIYRGGPNRLRESLWIQARMSVDLDACTAWTRQFHKAYPGFQKINAFVQKQATNNGYISYWNGRRRRFPRVGQDKAFNSLIQGGGSQILLDAMNKIHDANVTGEINARMVNVVHDSVWVMVPSNAVDYNLTRVQELMSEGPESFFDLPFPTDRKLIAK